jgi:hypothetical protein
LTLAGAVELERDLVALLHLPPVENAELGADGLLRDTSWRFTGDETETQQRRGSAPNL